MTPVSRRPFLLATTTLLAAAALPGCFGSFAATNALWKFNKGVSDSKWLQWLLFLGLIILPVYELFTFADAIVFNTIEFFTGKNVISASTKDLGNGRKLALARDAKDMNVVRAELSTRHDDGSVSRKVFLIQKEEAGFALLDVERRLLGRVTDERGLVVLFGADGRRLLALDLEAATAMTDAIASGASPSAVIEEHVRSTGHASAIASARAGAAAF